jgi:hypothetical protein
VVALTLVNEKIGATAVMARRAAAIWDESDAADGGAVGEDNRDVSDR